MSPVAIVLRDTPPELMLGLLAAVDAFHREIQVTGLDTEGEAPVDQPTYDGLVHDRSQLDVPRNTIHDQVVAGRDAGRAVIDVAISYSEADLARSRSAAAAVGGAHEAAVRGELLAAPLTSEQHRLWRWCCEQIDVQAAGGAPTPFPPARGAPDGPPADVAVD